MALERDLLMLNCTQDPGGPKATTCGIKTTHNNLPIVRVIGNVL
jgi:hypothetical protein